MSKLFRSVFVDLSARIMSQMLGEMLVSFLRGVFVGLRKVTDSKYTAKIRAKSTMRIWLVAGLGIWFGLSESGYNMLAYGGEFILYGILAILLALIPYLPTLCVFGGLAGIIIWAMKRKR